jgi:hypothetical protein
MGDWAPYPEDARTDEGQPSVRLVVDGEQFDVREEPGRPGQYHFSWASGPNSDYGFTSARSDGRPESTAELREAIRDFLAQVDPETGFIE